MFSLEPTKFIKKQFKTLEDRARNGSLGENDKDSLAKIYHCFLNLSINPQSSGLRTTPYSDKDFNNMLKDMAGKRVKCYHSYIENRGSSPRRLYWYYDNGSIRLVGIARHTKEGSERDKPKFKDLAEENLSEEYMRGYKEGYDSVKARTDREKG